MPAKITCPGCKTTLRVRSDLAGKNVKCPRCAQWVVIPAKDAIQGKEPEEVEPLPEDEAAQEDETRAPRSKYKACPRCGAGGARRIKWTPWGSFYGPRLFNHVRCQECGYAYNGRTGGSNLVPAIIFVTVPLLGIIGILVGLLLLLKSRGYF
jgi:predicted Zn finger-like uncharacterized protein